MATRVSRIGALVDAAWYASLSLFVSRSFVKIYPTGQGHFALGSPDGPAVFPGDSLTVLLAGRRVTGTIRPGSQGDYLQLADGSCCGLCACMRVVATVSQGQKMEVAR